MDLNSIQLRY